ncbi:MAG: ATP-binding protein [Campylobacterales bacterium]|nr:ATP-binding protein [Campylobacterales bacterium]
MSNFGIKAKMIFIFVVIKVLPLLLIAYVSVEGTKQLNEYFLSNTKSIFDKGKKVLKETADSAISDSIEALDKKSQDSIEKLSFMLATKVADFLYERDSDLLFLSKMPINQKTLHEFYKSKNRDILIHEPYIYDDTTHKWISSKKPTRIQREKTTADLKDNEKKFHYIDPIKLNSKTIPLYKEISYFDLKGKEIYKISSIDKRKKDISKKRNTYIRSETYFQEIKNLNKGEIYVSDVIGAYVKSNMIGTFTKPKSKKSGLEFKPEEHGYAGIENPVGKRFDGIMRFVTPVYKNGKKRGYLSLALDHRHLMEFTDTFNPVDADVKQNISDAGAGNYAFMWDHKSRSISHPRDYFIAGFDPKTGERVAPWISKDIADKFKESKGKDLNKFLENYPTYENQSLQKKPNIAQIKGSGQIALDCRYVNFAPQCQGWKQLVENGGYGSFVIFWSKVWKLSTAAAIPYYTGRFGKSKMGFGFITIGANVEEFHSAANKTKQKVNTILNQQTNIMKKTIDDGKNFMTASTKKIVNELTVYTGIMVIIVIFIAIWMSNYITGKINNLVKGTSKFANNEMDYRIDITSDDEIGALERSFNEMAEKISKLINKQKNLNEHLEDIVEKRTKELTVTNQKIRDLLDHSEEGFLSFSEDLVISNQYSKECTKFFTGDISGQDFGNLLFPNDQHKRDFFDDTFTKLAKETSKLKIDLILSLLQKDFILNGRSVELRYKVLGGGNFMTIITDVTDKKILEAKIQKEHKTLQMIVSTVTNKSEFFDLYDSYKNFISQRSELIDKEKTPFNNISKIYRDIHTFKGLFSQKNFLETPMNLHQLEEKISKLLETQTSTNKELSQLLVNCNLEEYFEKDLKVIKEILGENFFNERHKIEIDEKTIDKIEDMVRNFTKNHKDSKECLVVIESLEKLKAKPFVDLFSSYPKLVEQISTRLKKSIYPLHIVGDETIIVSEIYKPLVKSFIHIFRNSVDHGIESSEERVEKNKSESGTISCIIKEEKERYHILIGDDGRGIDIEAVKRKAIEKDLFLEDELTEINDETLVDIIFSDSFTTKDNVSDFSGRGIGLAAVKNEVEKLGGEIVLKTKNHIGTTFHFYIPKVD